MKLENEKPDVVCVGMSCADIMVPGLDLSLPLNEEMMTVEQIPICVGGDATNQSMVMAQLGLKTQLLTGVGKDVAGRLLEDAVKAAGVDTSGFLRSGERPTSVTMIPISPEGTRKFVHIKFDSTACVFQPDVSYFQGARVVSLGSLMTPPLLDPAVAKNVIFAARKAGAVICADVIYDGYGDVSFSDYGDGLREIDYFFPNDEEAEMITGKTDLDEMADAFLSYGIRHVVIKAGKQGCLFKSRTERFLEPAFVAKAVDTTGAGDNFASGFITALLEGKSHRECCRFAHAVAAIAVESVGANVGVKSREQVERFLSTHQQSKA